jgi:hypothetical protein
MGHICISAMNKLGIKCIAFVVVVVMFVFYTSPAVPSDIPGYSDMAQVSRNKFLTINDRKNPKEPGYRLGIISIENEDGIIFTPISVADWMDEDREPRDMEACCTIPGRDGEFLIAESGYRKGRFGRIFHITLFKDKKGDWGVTVNKVFKIYNRKLDAKNKSYKGDQVEGMACFSALGKTVLVYGERGGSTYDGKKVGTIVWGAIDLETYQFKKLGEAPLVNKSIFGDRDCSALHLIPNEDGAVSVLSVATQDEGKNGPFNSLVYRAGRFEIDENKKTIQFVRNPEPQILAELSGIKVEALSGPAGNAPKSTYSITTDDENLGGIWRPLLCE